MSSSPYRMPQGQNPTPPAGGMSLDDIIDHLRSLGISPDVLSQLRSQTGGQAPGQMSLAPRLPPGLNQATPWTPPQGGLPPVKGARPAGLPQLPQGPPPGMGQGMGQGMAPPGMPQGMLPPTNAQLQGGMQIPPPPNNAQAPQNFNLNNLMNQQKRSAQQNWWQGLKGLPQTT